VTVREHKPSQIDVAIRDPIDVLDGTQLIRWCREYAKDIHLDPCIRFAIGVYQIAQAKEWPRDSLNSCLEWAAAIIHTIGAAEQLDADIALDLQTHIPDVDILYALAGIQRELIYAHATSKSGHISRFDRNRLRQMTISFVYGCLAQIPRLSRREAFENAMTQIAENEHLHS